MRMLGRIFLLLLALCLGAAGWQWWGYSHRQLVAPNAEVVFDVPRGHAGARLAEVLQQAGVDVPSWKMALALRLRGFAASSSGPGVTGFLHRGCRRGSCSIARFTSRSSSE